MSQEQQQTLLLYRGLFLRLSGLFRFRRESRVHRSTAGRPCAHCPRKTTVPREPSAVCSHFAFSRPDVHVQRMSFPSGSHKTGTPGRRHRHSPPDLHCGGEPSRLRQHHIIAHEGLNAMGLLLYAESSRVFSWMTPLPVTVYHLRPRYRLALSARLAQEAAGAEPEPEPEPDDSMSHERPVSEDSRSTHALVYGDVLPGGEQTSSDDGLCPISRCSIPRLGSAAPAVLVPPRRCGPRYHPQS